MLIVTAHNVTEGGLPTTKSKWRVNYRPIWHGSVNGHKRDEGASALLRLIADRMDA